MTMTDAELDLLEHGEMSGEDVVELRFHYQERDFTAAYREEFWRGRSRFYLMMIGLAVFLLWTSSGRGAWLGRFALLWALLAIGTSFVANWFVRARQIFRKIPILHDEYRTAFSEQGIDQQTSASRTLLLWRYLAGVRVYPHSYLLLHPGGMFNTVPKRVFADEEQRRRFERLMTQHVKNVAWIRCRPMEQPA